MCARCADLEAEIASLRQALGVSILTAEISALTKVLRVSPQEAWLLVTLYRAPRPMRSQLLAVNMPVHTIDPEDRTTAHIVVMVSKLRSRLGAGAILTAWGTGCYSIGEQGRRLIAEALDAHQQVRAA